VGSEAAHFVEKRFSRNSGMRFNAMTNRSAIYVAIKYRQAIE
jgi:hypothetical protein